MVNLLRIRIERLFQLFNELVDCLERGNPFSIELVNSIFRAISRSLSSANSIDRTVTSATLALNSAIISIEADIEAANADDAQQDELLASTSAQVKSGNYQGLKIYNNPQQDDDNESLFFKKKKTVYTQTDPMQQSTKDDDSVDKHSYEGKSGSKR